MSEPMTPERIAYLREIAGEGGLFKPHVVRELLDEIERLQPVETTHEDVDDDGACNVPLDDDDPDYCHSYP